MNTALPTFLLYVTWSMDFVRHDSSATAHDNRRRAACAFEFSRVHQIVRIVSYLSPVFEQRRCENFADNDKVRRLHLERYKAKYRLKPLPQHLDVLKTLLNTLNHTFPLCHCCILDCLCRTCAFDSGYSARDATPI